MLLVSSTPRERLIELARMIAPGVTEDRDMEYQYEIGLAAHVFQAGGKQGEKRV